MGGRSLGAACEQRMKHDRDVIPHMESPTVHTVSIGLCSQSDTSFGSCCEPETQVIQELMRLKQDITEDSLAPRLKIEFVFGFRPFCSVLAQWRQSSTRLVASWKWISAWLGLQSVRQPFSTQLSHQWPAIDAPENAMEHISLAEAKAVSELDSDESGEAGREAPH